MQLRQCVGFQSHTTKSCRKGHIARWLPTQSQCRSCQVRAHGAAQEPAASATSSFALRGAPERPKRRSRVKLNFARGPPPSHFGPGTSHFPSSNGGSCNARIGAEPCGQPAGKHVGGSGPYRAGRQPGTLGPAASLAVKGKARAPVCRPCGRRVGTPTGPAWPNRNHERRTPRPAGKALLDREKRGQRNARNLFLLCFGQAR